MAVHLIGLENDIYFQIGILDLEAASRHSIGTGVVSGMLAAIFLAIVFIPLYYLVSKLRKK